MQSMKLAHNSFINSSPCTYCIEIIFCRISLPMAAWRILKSLYNFTSSTYYIKNTFYPTRIINVYSLSTIFVKLTSNLPVNLFTLKTIRVNYNTLETLHHSSGLIYDCLNLGLEFSWEVDVDWLFVIKKVM